VAVARRRRSCRGFRVSCYRACCRPLSPSARYGPDGARSYSCERRVGPRVALVPLYAVWDLRPGTRAPLLSLSLSLSGGETEHDATAALITLVATHMLNVHPVTPAATAAVTGKGDVLDATYPRGVACVCVRTLRSSRACDADQARVCRTSDLPASGACVYANVKRRSIDDRCAREICPSRGGKPLPTHCRLVCD